MSRARPTQASARHRLMLAIGGLGTGGSEKQLTEFILRVPRDRFDPILLTIGEGTEPQGHRQRLLAAGIPIISIEPPRGEPPRPWIQLVSRYAMAINSIKPDIAYPWLDETSAAIAPICRLMGIPCVVARRNSSGSATEHRYPRLGRGIRWAETLATLVTANSAAVAAECAARGHAPDRIRIVPNGHEHVPPLSRPPSPPVVLGYVAQFRKEKGHHRLIDALERLAGTSWRLDLAGDGPLRAEIEARVERGGLRERVKFVGSVTDIRAFWRDRHIAVLFSDTEGLPNALLEAAFAGRAVIATRTGGTPEVVGLGGLLVGLADPEATAAAMTQLIDDPVRQEQLGAEIWKHVAGTYSMQNMVDAHVGALEEAIRIARNAWGARHRA